MISKALAGTSRAVEALRGRGSARAAHHFAGATKHLRGATAYDGLHSHSLAMASAPVRSLGESLNVVLPQLAVSSMFAGARTAIQVGLRLADLLDVPVRLIGLTGTMTGELRTAVENLIRSEYASSAFRVAAVLGSEELSQSLVGSEDRWLATHWTTAHSIDVAARLGVVNPKRVIYLIQDYEPGFSPWSTDFALARSTYHAGFAPVVNSSPLATYLRAEESLVIDDQLVFQPDLDLDRLERAWNLRQQIERRRRSVLFYARPDKPRNLFAIGMSALALVALEDESVEIRSAGASHQRPRSGPLSKMTLLGRTEWDRYFDHLAEADVLLSLQYSPHPSHPPLDAVVSGGLAVTNELGGVRGNLDPALDAVETDPQALAVAVQRSLELAKDGRSSLPFSADVLAALGDPLDRVLDQLASQVSS